MGTPYVVPWFLSYLLAAYRLDPLEHKVLVDVVDIGLALAKDEHWLGVGREVGRGVSG